MTPLDDLIDLLLIALKDGLNRAVPPVFDPAFQA
jgi:hypothetical protein